MVGTSPSSESPSASNNVQPFDPIAIVGVGMRAPGGIDSLATLWDTVINQKSHNACMATDPRFLRRFNPEDFEEMFTVTPDARTTFHANLFDETPGLDEAYFGISKRDSAGMDVQQKLLLHVAHEALEDAGFTGATNGSTFDPATFGVYIGSATDDFFKDPNSYPIDIYHLIRTQRAFLSGQISHQFGLEGPSVSVDTVCSGSMTAINDACRALATGECRAAIAGGVHVITPISAPPGAMALKLAGFLDPKGQCKPFLADGAGYCRAEAAGLVVLKRLSDAIREGDRIHAVIRGMGSGNMASARSIVRPDAHLQSVALGRAVASSGIDPSDISFVEAHGPGTQKGDPAELYSITTVLGNRHPDNVLPIGSIKGNVGHSEAASGSISLFKVLAMMRYQTLPPQASFHISNLNPRLQPFFDEHPIRISDREQKWDAEKRIAVVSNFGATGYSGHMVVEEGSSFHSSTDSSAVSASIFPFMISAKNQQTLLTLVLKYADWLDGEGASAVLSDLSYATTARREVHPFFVLVQATSTANLAEQLRSETLPIIDASSPKQPTLAFCFSGQGGPRLDPRQSSLYTLSSAFSSTVDTCFKLSVDEQLVADEDIEILELFALQAGLAAMWTSWGIAPVALAGHSFGEYNALVHAGVLSLRDALKLVGVRAALIREKCTGVVSNMAALRLPLADVRALLGQQSTTQVELACINSDNQVTLAGTPEDLNSFHEEVVKAHPSARWVLITNMRAAFHSRFVEPAGEELLAACKGVEFLPSKVTLLSGPLGRTCLPGDEALTQHDYLVRHCRETNCFGEAVRDFTTQNEVAGVDRPDWIELGPHSSTIGFIPVHPEQLKLPSQRKGLDGWTTTLDTLVKLRVAGHKVDFAAVHRDINPAARHVDLPRYPFQLQPHSYPVRKANRSFSKPVDNTIYPRVTAEELSPILKNHFVADTPICPAVVYISLALAAASPERKACSLSRMVWGAPFLSSSDNWLEVRKTEPSAFEVFSKGGLVHATLKVDMCDESRLLQTFSLLQPMVSSMRSIQTLPGTSVLNKRLTYDLFDQTIMYGPHCQGLCRVWVTEDGYQAWASSSNDPQETKQRLEDEPTVLQTFSPILIDRACQLIGLVVNISPARGRDEIFVACEVDQVEMAFSNVHDSVSFESYASFELSNGNEGAMAIGQVFTFDQNMRLVAVFRGIRLRRMKKRVLEHLVRRAAGAPKVPAPLERVAPVSSKPLPPHDPGNTLPSPLLTPDGTVEDSGNDQLRKTVSAMFHTTLGVEHIALDKKLAELGLDSLTSVEIGVELERLFPDRELPGEFLVDPETTLAKLFDLLRISPSSAVPRTFDTANLSDTAYSTSRSITPASDSSDSAMTVIDRIGANPELIQEKPGTLPMMLIHDGGGTALAYRLLGNLGRTVLGVHSPGLQEGKGIVNIRHAAAQYAVLARQWLDQHSPDRPQLLVGGWSLGGAIAMALAAAHPDLVAGVILLDSRPPGTVTMKPDEAERLLPCANTSSSGGFSTLVRTQLKMNAQALSIDPDRQGGQGDLIANLKAPVYLVSAVEPLSDHNIDATISTPPGSCSEWMLSHEHASMSERGWQGALGNLLIGTERTAGDHFTMFTHTHAASTTRAVQQAADALEAVFQAA